MVQNFVSREKVTLQEMQSLVGILNFFCKAITSTWHPLGKCMTMCGVLKPQYHIMLSADIKSDLDMLLMILKSFNGVVFFQQQEDLLVLKFFTESAGANQLGWAFGFSTMACALECSRNNERYHIP